MPLTRLPSVLSPKSLLQPACCGLHPTWTETRHQWTVKHKLTLKMKQTLINLWTSYWYFGTLAKQDCFFFFFTKTNKKLAFLVLKAKFCSRRVIILKHQHTKESKYKLTNQVVIFLFFKHRYVLFSAESSSVTVMTAQLKCRLTTMLENTIKCYSWPNSYWQPLWSCIL